MRKELDKKIIVEEIIAASESYKNQLVGKKFLYVFDNRYIEVIYKATNFRHLTGVATKLSAKEFYKLAVQRKLRAQQIYFSDAHPFRLCKKKVKHIGEIATLAGTESFLLEEITTQTQTYKFGTTELSFTLCFNKEYDVTGQEKSECYVVESLRDEDCFEKSKNVYTVTHIFSKDNDAKKYNNILYIEKESPLEELPENIKGKLSANILGEEETELK